MYCPQCGTEAQANVQYCRVCGSNLKVIGKAVSLSEAIARSDRGPLPKFREMVKNLKVDHVTEEVSRALDHMNQEIALVETKRKPKSREERRPWINLRKKKTAAERRENHITKGVVSMFSGVGLTVFLYFLSTTLILKLPPEIVGQIPFEIQSVVRIIWLLGLLPVTSGLGHILAGLLIRPDREPQPQLDQVVSPPRELTDRPLSDPVPMSVTDHTTNLLEPDRVPAHKKAQTTH
jgi:hypothetical protein